MITAVLPYRSDGSPERRRNLEAIQSRWIAEGVSVVKGEGKDGPWSKGSAVWEAMTLVETRWAVISDADVWTDGVVEALRGMERTGRRWAVPYGKVYRLTDEATERWIEHGRPVNPTFDRWPYEGHAGGGIVVMRTEDYSRVPMDPRFLGWGQEDDAWSLALHLLLGRPYRVRCGLWHLWHPPQEKMNDYAGSQESLDLYARYRACRRDPKAMRCLLGEGRRLLSG